MTRAFDVVVVGGGHNALVAATYLAKAGHTVLVLERLDQVGGAAVSAEPFPGVPARLSRYSYLVSLLPDRIVSDLGLRLELRSRAVASYTPDLRGGTATGLLVERDPGPATAASFREVTGSDAALRHWTDFYHRLDRLAQAIAPTLLQPLPTRDQARKLVTEAVDERLWRQLFEQPLGQVLTETFTDDLVRGVAATDGLIGTHASVHGEDLAANRCFLYHVIGNGTGEWRVPVGGMGSVTAELRRVAEQAGVVIQTGAEVRSVDADGTTAEVGYLHHGVELTAAARYVLSGVAPAVLDRLRGRRSATPAPQGSQLKINVLLTRLPALRSGIDPTQAFAGTFHLDESLEQLETAYRASLDGTVPEFPPGEMYCHTLTDPSILDQELAARGWHTLTLFGLHTPASLFAPDNAGTRAELVERFLAGLNRHLAEPIQDCLATDGEGNPCIEARTPLDVEADLAMPGGHIFHGDLGWPFAEDASGNGTTDNGTADNGADGVEPGTWGVETDVANLFRCGSGARRGGAVSGIGGHNAAMAVLSRTGGDR